MPATELTLGQFVGLKFGQMVGLRLNTENQLATKQTTLSLTGISGSRGWWPIIKESVAGAWQRNEEIHPETVLSNPTLFACITLIAGDIAKLRLKLMEQDPDGIWVETESPAFSPVLRKPNHYQSRIDFFEWWMISKLVHGNTYVLKARDNRGVVVAMYILDPYRVKPLVSSDGAVFYQLYQDDLAPSKDLIVPAREMIHDVICPLFHPLVGVSPIYAAGFPALQGLNIRRQSNAFFMNGSKPGGVLTAPGHIDKETALRVKEYWDGNFVGDDNIGKVAVLGDGLKYEAMAVTAEQADLVAQLRMTDEDICKCFHMPRHKVGVGPDPSYNNIEALNIQYYGDCLQKHIEKLEIKLDEGLGLVGAEGRKLGTEFERDDLAQMDSASLITSEKEASGIKMVNESRRRLGLPKVKGGDTIYVQQQYYSLEALNRRDEMPAPATPPDAQPQPDVDVEAPDDSEDMKSARMLQFSARLSAKMVESARRNATEFPEAANG